MTCAASKMVCATSKMMCAASKIVCATRRNDVRSWQNGVRAVSDGTDVLGKMMCALMCALVCALMCAPVAGVPVAQRISFSSDSQSDGGTVGRPATTRRPQRGRVARSETGHNRGDLPQRATGHELADGLSHLAASGCRGLGCHFDSECQSARFWHFGTQLGLALGTLALSSVWHLALWHSARFGTWHFGTWVAVS
jgi:hypothetical protein